MQLLLSITLVIIFSSPKPAGLPKHSEEWKMILFRLPLSLPLSPLHLLLARPSLMWQVEPPL